MSELTNCFRSVTAAVERIVEVETDPDAETPCEKWDYAQLLDHLVGGDRLFVSILSGSGPAAPSSGDRQKSPSTPEDYRSWSGRLAELLAEPEVLSSVHELPVGALPGPQVVVLRSVEHLLHGWDLAKAAGAATTDLQAPALALLPPAQALLAAVGERALAGRRPFAPSVAVDAEADVLTRFVALFGRDPCWEPDPVAGYAKLKERFAGHTDVELPDGTRRGYGADGMRVADQVFACTYRDRLMIKLPEQQVASLIGSGLGRPLAKPGQRPMREWVLVPFDGSAASRADQAYAFVSGRSR
ncbi:MAG TPA: TIGR03086 family metal-binding protein [Microlunatus sp.]|nr:TIGR03086 family metal-binding protein [Microlunatus sp.]